MRSFNVLKFRPAKHVVFRIRLSQAAAAIRSRVRRTHGGAVSADYLVHGGSSSAQRNGSRIAEKTRIAQCASELIEDRESVILNGGSTTRLFAFELGGKKDLTVVTNSLGIPAALSRQTVRDIVVLGANTGRSLISPWVQSLSAERSQSAPIAPYSESGESHRTVFLPSCYRMQR
jgi:hypothetical protein